MAELTQEEQRAQDAVHATLSSMQGNESTRASLFHRLEYKPTLCLQARRTPGRPCAAWSSSCGGLPGG